MDRRSVNGLANGVELGKVIDAAAYASMVVLQAWAKAEREERDHQEVLLPLNIVSFEKTLSMACGIVGVVVFHWSTIGHPFELFSALVGVMSASCFAISGAIRWRRMRSLELIKIVEDVHSR